MNLIADIGNTNTKLAVYENSKRLSLSRLSDLNCKDLEKIMMGFNIERTIISSVKILPPNIYEFFTGIHAQIHILTYESRLPFRIDYQTPETLGTDRIAAVAGAYYSFPGQEVLIIDAGTALTFDFLSPEAYNGGNISPGLKMRLKALNKFTDKLPLVHITENFTNPGRNTTDAILAGVMTGITYEINEYIRTFKNKHSEFRIILTGGDSELLKDKIDYPITYMPDIVIDGLNYILEYNAK